MFKVDDIILYGTEGVCRIKEITSKKFGDYVNDYYVLEPVYGIHSILYVPIKNKKLTSRMRHVLSVDKVYELIKAMEDVDDVWIENEKLRQSKYKEIISQGDYDEIIKIIKSLYSHKQNQIALGRKFHKADEDLLNFAQTLLHNEFAHVLKIEPEEVLPFILEEMKITSKNKM
ncbi:CarD family transcriptional regulator [Terrisporobacter sp.]|uniref:CarD family transcriptional regulator n=1 Tax=Terrisporobacter sp. TaxID=1965305 RepID=UPI002618158B|nr:CarD family transcriptional regulator [Terrisporobacter sp.]